MSEEFQDIKSKQTILQHGLSVWNKFEQLYQFLGSAEETYNHPLPQWCMDYRRVLVPILQENLSDIENYLIYHDCGKPFCLTINESGRHFEDHAEKSKEIFSKFSDNKLIANLIGKDMLCHITKPKDFDLISKDKHIEILLCAALSELHSNAIMFGGFDSDSFKIKFKNLTKLGSRILSEKYKD